MHYNEINLVEFIESYKQKDIFFCTNPGNAGDALIAYSTYSIFEQLNIQPKIINYLQCVNNKIIFYSGGGNLVEGKYTHAANFIKNNYQQNKEIVILPHTVFGYEELILSANNLKIICRDKKSYNYLHSIGFSLERLYLCSDLAFLINVNEFDIYHKKGIGIANCMRTDGESSQIIELKKNNIDISLSWNGDLWNSKEFSKVVVHSLACYLSNFKTIKTDRLHIAILAAFLGKDVILYSNNYYKNKEVYEYSIKNKFDNVSFIELEDQKDMKYLENKITDLALKLSQTENKLFEKDNIIKVLEENNKLLQNILLSNSWKLTKPFRFIKSIFKE